MYINKSVKLCHQLGSFISYHSVAAIKVIQLGWTDQQAGSLKLKPASWLLFQKKKTKSFLHRKPWPSIWLLLACCFVNCEMFACHIKLYERHAISWKVKKLWILRSAFLGGSAMMEFSMNSDACTSSAWTSRFPHSEVIWWRDENECCCKKNQEDKASKLASKNWPASWLHLNLPKAASWLHLNPSVFEAGFSQQAIR